MISVIIPSFNQQEYLSDCIESVLEQDIQGELIIIDDGSEDESLKIAKKYEAERPGIVRVISQSNRGLASARNTGIMNSRYPLFLPLDADDMLLPNTITKLLQLWKDSNADFVSPSFKTFGTMNDQVILMKDPKLEDFRLGNRIGYCSLFNKQKVAEVGGYNTKMIWGYEDMELTCNLLARGNKLTTTSEILWLYRTKEQSMITEAVKHHQELLDIINKSVPEAKLNF